MKTTRFLMMFVAAAAMIFASCGKDDVDNLADNTLVYDGEEYQMTPDVYYFHSELTRLMAMSVKKDANDEPVVRFDGLHIRPQTWNRSMDLASPVEGDEWIVAFIGTVLNCDCSYEYGHIAGELNGQQYSDESIFASGTLLVKGNNDGTPITVTLDGKLKDGKKIQMKLVTGSYDVQ